ncbi:MAG: PEP-CTERM sorting domain-containing protein, partial [Myxococcota bacterium]
KTSYWTGTEHALDTNNAWDFGFNGGGQGVVSKGFPPGSNGNFAWAVADGNVANVPEPSAGLLLGIGLVAFSAIRRPGKGLPSPRLSI